MFVYLFHYTRSLLSVHRPSILLITMILHTEHVELNSKEYAASGKSYHGRASWMFPLWYPPLIKLLSGPMKPFVKGH